MKIIGIFRPGMSHHVYWLTAFKDGLRRHGLYMDLVPYVQDVTTDIQTADVVVTWSWFEDISRAAKNYCVLENPYFGDKQGKCSAGWNGLNGYADFCNSQSPSDRWSHEIPSFKNGGSYILILGQVPGDRSLKGTIPPYEQWAKTLQSQTHLPVYFRAHPKARSGHPKLRALTGDLSQALDGAFAAVAFNSSASVDSVLAGVPTITLDRGSMAWDVTSHDLDLSGLVRPNLAQWCYNLSYTQWTIAEMATGKTWQHICKKLL